MLSIAFYSTSRRESDWCCRARVSRQRGPVRPHSGLKVTFDGHDDKMNLLFQFGTCWIESGVVQEGMETEVGGRLGGGDGRWQTEPWESNIRDGSQESEGTIMWNKFQPGPLLDQRAGQAGSMNCDCNQVHGHKSNFIMNKMRKTGARSPCLLDGVWDVRLPWRAGQHCLQLYDRARVTCHSVTISNLFVSKANQVQSNCEYQIFFTCPSTVRVVQAGQACVHSVDLTSKIVCLHMFFINMEFLWCQFSWQVHGKYGTWYWS